MKYSINSIGFIVAERDIYSLGGFIPKGSVGCKVANEDQISQDGECWVSAGDITFRPDVRVKDNAYIGTFTPGDGSVHTDGITEFSGNTLIPGNISVRSLVADTKNNFFAKDSFIGVSMDVLCGPVATATAFPFAQGRLNYTKPAGTPMADAVVADENSCFSNKPLIIGKDTQVYVPSGVGARVLWAYRNNSNVVTYSGESQPLPPGLNKISHMSYGMCFLYFTTGVALNPERLPTLGAKILGHISGSLLMDLRPESASGQYVMDKSSILMNTDNFGLATTQLRRLAGSMYDTNVYTPGGSTNYKIYGTFHNVQRLEYTMPLGDAHKTNVNRDTYISAYDCPLLRVDSTTYNDALAAKGNLTLRRCIVPKAEFQDDVINGNTYEDIDFSYANEDLGYVMTGYTRFISSHEQGIYRMSGGPSSTGFASHKGNLDSTARLYQGEIYLPLDGSIMEQGAYGGGSQIPYESAKTSSAIRIRTGKPLATFGLIFPSLPAGYSVKALYYLDEDFIIRSTITDPTELVTTYPYVVMLFRKDDDTAINVTDFIALNRTLRIIDHTKVPEITGSAYVGAGCTVRGDVQLIGDPYVNRVFDVDQWERGGVAYSAGKSWGEMRDGSNPSIRMSSKHIYPVSPGDTISLTGPYRLGIVCFDSGKKSISDTGWITGTVTVPTGASYAGFGLSSNPDGKLLEYSDIPLANVKYVRAFKKRRYIVNELDRVSPKDILLGPDYWEQGGLSIAEGNAGKPYEDLKIGSPYRIRLKRPFGLGAGYRVTFSSGYSFGTSYYDAVTKLLYGSTSANMDNALFTLVGSIAGSPTATITPADVTTARVVIEFTPSPRIIVPYGSATLTVNGMRIRMYDNAVLSRNLNQEGEIVLQGDAVMGYDFNSGDCMCSNGHSDAIIKLP